MELKANYNTLVEMEEFLKKELNMCNYKILYDGEQPMYMVVETTDYKMKKVKIKKDSNRHCSFWFLIRTKEDCKNVRLSTHRVEYLVKNPYADISGLVIDHIDNNPENNAIWNLQAITPRQNTAKERHCSAVATKHSKDYCQSQYESAEKAYSMYLESHKDISHKSLGNAELARLKEKARYWKTRLVYATQTNQK